MCAGLYGHPVLFGIHEVLKKYEHSKFSHLLIEIFFFTADDGFADVSALCSMNKILKIEDE